MVVQTAAAKAISLAGQLLLARLLLPADFGLFGMALTATAFPGLIQNAGIADILIQRQAKFRRWANAAFWLSLTLGVLAGLLTVVTAPLAARFYHRPELQGLICVLAFGPPLLGLSVVPRAQLSNQLRFRAIALTGLLEASGTVVLSIVFAYAGLGAYSFVLPKPIVAGLLTAVLWFLARTPLRWTPQVRRWRFLAGHALTLLGVAVAWMVVLQGDYAMLGRFHSSRVVGLYYFAYSLSGQTVVLLTLNVASVLFPALSRLTLEPQRQMQALLRSSAAISILAGPFCVLQALLAPLLIPLLFGVKWTEAVPMFQFLTIGMTVVIGSYSSRNLIKAQGRFGALLVLSVAYAMVFITAVWIAASHGGALAVAATVAGCFAVFEPLHVLIAIQPAGGGWRELWSGFGAPLAATALAAAAGFGIMAIAQNYSGRAGWVQFGSASVGSILVYLFSVRWLAPEAAREVLRRVSKLRRATAS
jgi:PST family polysaccharide transporter